MKYVYVVYLEELDSNENIERVEFDIAFYDKDKADYYCDKANKGCGGSYHYYVQYVEIGDEK